MMPPKNRALGHRSFLGMFKRRDPAIFYNAGVEDALLEMHRRRLIRRRAVADFYLDLTAQTELPSRIRALLSEPGPHG